MKKTQEQRIREMGQEVIELLAKKDQDYGSSFSDTYKDYGILTGLLRMEDKLKRIKNLVKGHQEKVDESIDDTLLDLCGYALLTLVERKKEEGVNGQ